MALSKTIEAQFGATLEGCYLRVEHPTLTKDTLSFNLRVYADITKPFFEESVITCPYELLGENPFKQAYIHLKTLPEFADSTDI
jgi:hypothetical protein